MHMVKVVLHAPSKNQSYYYVNIIKTFTWKNLLFQLPRYGYLGICQILNFAKKILSKLIYEYVPTKLVYLYNIAYKL